jgi:hypothetical protein
LCHLKLRYEAALSLSCVPPNFLIDFLERLASPLVMTR